VPTDRKEQLVLLRGEPLAPSLLVAPVEEPAKRGAELEELAVGRVIERQGLARNRLDDYIVSR
jgi:hypothetical protein